MAPLVAARGVCKAYAEFRLADVDLRVSAGDLVGLVGPNGAGKTTLIKILLGMVHRDAGGVEVLGHGPERKPAAARRHIGFVHESGSFYDHLSAHALGRAVGLFYPSWDRGRFGELLDRFEVPPHKRIRGLSRGMPTKLALAISLSHSARLLLLDEPTAGLNPIFRRELLDELRAVLADDRRVVLLRAGGVAMQATLEELRDRWHVVRGDAPALPRRPVRCWSRTGCIPTGSSGLPSTTRSWRQSRATRRCGSRRPSTTW